MKRRENRKTIIASHGNTFVAGFFLSECVKMKSSSNNRNGNHGSRPLDQGVVIKKIPGVYIVETNRPDTSVSCTLAAALRKQAEAGKLTANKRKMRPNREPDLAETVVVGDQVLFTQVHNGTGEIIDILPRRNKLSRRSPVPMPDARPHENLIAANVDQVVPVLAAAKPSPRWNLLDRYLVLAESLELPALICITKLDLADGDDGMISEDLETELEVYCKLGYPIVLTSSLTGEDR
jgi:putative ribosome biogenesis GTPase RsgA